MNETNWPQVVTDLRQTGGLKLREIAEAAGCTPSTVSDIESGRTIDPSARVGIALADLHKKTMRKAARRKA